MSGGTNAVTFGTANGWDTLNINSNTAANTINLANDTAIAAVATGNKVTVGGTKALTIVGDGDAIGGSLRTNGVVITKDAGAGTVVFTNNAAVTSAFFNRAVIDTLDLTTKIASTAVTVNEATTVKLSFDQTSAAAVTYDVDNNGSTQITAGTGTLKLDVAASQSSKALTLGAGVGTVKMSATTSNVTLAEYDTATKATTVDTTAISGTKNVTVSLWTNNTNDVLSATDLTGTLTVTKMVAAGVIIGGSGNDSLTIGDDVASVVRGGAGNDTINGAAATSAKVSLFGDAGDDNITGGDVGDVLDGGDGNDLLTGGKGSDTMTGGAGTDTIVAGAGDDVLTGGAGDDVFTFAAADKGVDGASAPSATSFDTITDWAAGDKIDWDAAVTIVTNTTASSGVAAISSTGLASFNSADSTLALKLIAVEAAINAGGTAASGQAAVFVSGADTYLFISNGTGGVDAGDELIKLTGVTATTGFTINGSGDISSIA